MNSIKNNQKEKPKLANNIINKRHSNNYILNSNIRSNFPEIKINKTIKQFIKSKKYIKQINNGEENKQYKYNTSKKTLNNKNNKKLLIKNKNKSAKFKNNINKLLNVSKPYKKINGANIEESNNHYSTLAYTINVCKSENLNEIIKKENECYRNINSDSKEISNRIENNENLNKSGKKLKNELIIDSKVNLTKKINVNKNSKLIKKKISEKNFKKERYINGTFPNYRSSNNIFEGNDIYSAIKNLEKFKVKNKAWAFKEKVQLSDDKMKSLPNKTPNINKIKKEKINIIYKNTSPKLYDKRINLKKDDRKRLFSSEKKINNRKIGNSLKIKEDNIFSNPIIKNLFHNANKIEKKSIKKGRDFSNSRLNTLLGNYKNECLTINNNNTNIIKCGYSFKGRYFFEYRNQLQN